jgi:hypothetical protein
MIDFVFNTCVIRKDKGCYIAHAENMAVTGETATTVRGAVKKLKDAVLQYLRAAVE